MSVCVGQSGRILDWSDVACCDDSRPSLEPMHPLSGVYAGVILDKFTFLFIYIYIYEREREILFAMFEDAL